MKKRLFSQWIKALDIALEKKVAKCPSCEVGNLRFQYVGDEKSRMGYLDLWCDSCNRGIHFSRVMIPENANMLSFDDNVADIIPMFKQIKPYS